MYCSPTETRKARRDHRCTNCGEVIEKGSTYKRWMSVDDSMCTNKMHPECRASLQDEDSYGNFEYTLYGGERPRAGEFGRVA